MKLYEWRNTKTGVIIDHDHWSIPPKKGNWVRVYSFGVGRVEGGASPSRVSAKKK